MFPFSSLLYSYSIIIIPLPLFPSNVDLEVCSGFTPEFTKYTNVSSAS
jgi:hypothetical protein